MSALLLLLASWAAAHDVLFDGSRGAKTPLPHFAPPAIHGRLVNAATAAPTVVPPDLAAAQARVGTAAMKSRVVSRPLSLIHI